ncbi:MAG: hypothetical protein KAT34_11145 [Candidatus Aminicenantes bacterium]|nr:hypothetical protein [Candidatus Aminicenantes bacterium]
MKKLKMVMIMFCLVGLIMGLSMRAAQAENKAKMSKTKLMLVATDSSTVTLTIQGVPFATGAIANYITPPGNEPKSFANHIYVWQTTANQVPWAKTPAGNTAVNTDSSTSTQKVGFDFEQKGYIMGYAVAPTPQAVCATVFMPANKQTDPTAWEYSKLTMEVVYHGTNLVQVKYGGLAGYTPQTNKNWIGIWNGGTVPYSGQDPIKTVTISSDTPNGYAIIEDIKLLIGNTYSLGYFMVDLPSGRTSLAATASFSVGASR